MYIAVSYTIVTYVVTYVEKDVECCTLHGTVCCVVPVSQAVFSVRQNSGKKNLYCASKGEHGRHSRTLGVYFWSTVVSVMLVYRVSKQGLAYNLDERTSSVVWLLIVRLDKKGCLFLWGEGGGSISYRYKFKQFVFIMKLLCNLIYQLKNMLVDNAALVPYNSNLWCPNKTKQIYIFVHINLCTFK